ncbi:helix-turn-helix transcriptional regulator [Luteimonas sp. FCS-9]|uniref:helix-turn-helix domain-containing protein n=1 Tax=Luteimonas sp. FCS-9 TaxID=1547516 RepID=UPI00063EBE92|nr:helix-turn-helix transcriptional regulator [Luteimonas sp. FCS-9]KLJ02545.1 DNA-binding protein [Luteimonas sp. FCS-9]
MSGKSIHKPEYKALLALLIEMRDKAELTQSQLAGLLERPQSYVSDVERGVRRLDLLQLHEYCHACGQDLAGFVRKFEKAIAGSSSLHAKASRAGRGHS